MVNYGAGNLGSVVRALQHSGCEPVMGSEAEAVLAADRLILPGVGAFDPAMKQLREKGLMDPILEFARSGKPLFGICLGMQMLGDESEEFGLHAGLGLVPGRVVPLPRRRADGQRIKVPNIGWCGIAPPRSVPDRWKGTIVGDVVAGEFVYFVHSFQLVPKTEADILAEAVYEGATLTAAVQRDNVFGAQFHPEKSGKVGLSIMQAFLRA